MLSHNLNLKIFFQEAISFGLIGIVSVFSVAKIYELGEISKASISWWQFLLAFGIGTAVILGLIRIMHGGLFLRIFFLLALFSGTLITLNLFLSDIWSLIISSLLVVLYSFYPYVWFHNLVLVLTLPGIAAVLGVSLTPYVAAVILIFMSVYDYIAVYKTKHMVKMAKAMIAGRAIFAMIYPEHWHGFKMRVNEAHPGEGFMMLGTGDFVFPIVMATSAYMVNARAAWIVLAASLLGLLLMHLIFSLQKIHRPMPALPPLAAFAIIGFLAATSFKF